MSQIMVLKTIKSIYIRNKDSPIMYLVLRATLFHKELTRFEQSFFKTGSSNLT